jgi:hypothetical protein
MQSPAADWLPRIWNIRYGHGVRKSIKLDRAGAIIENDQVEFKSDIFMTGHEVS